MNNLEKLKAEIKEMNVEEFAKWLNDYIHCDHCTYGDIMADCHDNCVIGMRDYLKQEIKPPKTLADVFFERNPKAEKNELGQPRSCAKHAGLISICPDTKCLDCWNRPYKESEE